ncbi:hypothetical protein CERSUDRAFT_114726 [Gelatoporia subvermispora B]|uniref:Uncharacterized protein n=1 Tax=Ceriporiopsis subvermispora (strain B) TaxID=914234 RepID=M2QXH3_CERS8|nr:hypothetical protein CERSUDRAFT_114726 [Gelatoporia subvermispora B]
MWQITAVTNVAASRLWFSDGLPMEQSRGGSDTSCRLIVDNQGFLDITEIDTDDQVVLDFNGVPIPVTLPHGTGSTVNICLTLPGDGSFLAAFVTTMLPRDVSSGSVSGELKPLPTVSASDVEFFDQMMVQKYIPYQNIPDAPGKTVEELKALGKQLFPFSPHSFQLAMAVYDWTTASFTRLVFMKIFEYTSIPQTPFPLDQASIAQMIWESDWGSYKPSDPDYMHSFMMTPAATAADVQTQLAAVGTHLHELSAVENRLLAAAWQALPRTPLVATPRLFSGQVDVYQLGLDRFGVEFLQCPLNAGPVGAALVMAFASALEAYVAPGHVVTTKMVWSFTDSCADAMHYENGILLVANPPADDAWVWEAAAHITPLSDDPAKTEYTFAPGTEFLVQSVDQATVGGKQVVVINIQPVPPAAQKKESALRRELNVGPLSVAEVEKLAAEYSPEQEQKVDVIPTKDGPQYRIPHKTRGRRCRCVDVGEGLLKAA